jgi:uncharacterized membrane protein required for colicin V production
MASWFRKPSGVCSERNDVTDILIGVGIFLFAALGFRDGFMRKIFGILGFWGGLIFATKFMNPLGEFFNHMIGLSSEIALILSFCVIFLAITLFVNLVYRWTGDTTRGTLPISSRFAGAILGAGQGVVAVSLILLMLNIFDVPAPESRKDSTLYHTSIKVAPAVFNYSTKWMPRSRAFIDEVKVTLQTFSIVQ